MTGYKKKFKSIEDAELFRLTQVKRTGRTDFRIEKVFPGGASKSIPLFSIKIPRKRSRMPKPI